MTDSKGKTPDVLPRPDFHFEGEVGRTYQESDPPTFPQPVQPPKGAPNVVVILLDDAGFGQFEKIKVRFICPSSSDVNKSYEEQNHIRTLN